MIEEATKILDCFFKISEKQITKDLKRVEDNIELIQEEVNALHAIDYKLRSPDNEAQLLHLSLIKAYELCRLPHVAQEVKTFYAGFGAGHVMQNAEQAAHNKDSLKNLNDKMNEIRLREGLSDDEYWHRGEGPDDYEKLEAQYEEISEGIENTIMGYALCRYRLAESADLFENDPREFEIQREIGRRALFSEKQEELSLSKFMDKHVIDEYGEQTLKRIQARANELKKRNG